VPLLAVSSTVAGATGVTPEPLAVFEEAAAAAAAAGPAAECASGEKQRTISGVRLCRIRYNERSSVSGAGLELANISGM